jgi:hypothetical protein
MDDKIISCHVPKTQWFHDSGLQGMHFPFRIVGLDMGIDSKGKVWFIEANTKPNFHGLGKLDPKQYQRYLRAQKLIDSR